MRLARVAVGTCSAQSPVHSAAIRSRSPDRQVARRSPLVDHRVADTDVAPVEQGQPVTVASPVAGVHVTVQHGVGKPAGGDVVQAAWSPSTSDSTAASSLAPSATRTSRRPSSSCAPPPGCGAKVPRADRQRMLDVVDEGGLDADPPPDHRLRHSPVGEPELVLPGTCSMRIARRPGSCARTTGTSSESTAATRRMTLPSSARNGGVALNHTSPRVVGAVTTTERFQVLRWRSTPVRRRPWARNAASTQRAGG